MSDGKYGTKAGRLRQIAAQNQIADASDLPSSIFELPTIRNSEEAVAIGQQLTPHEYCVLEGARLWIKRMFDALAFDLRNASEQKQSYVNQLRADYAFQMQMIREAQEVAPDLTLAALLKADLTGDRRENRGPEPDGQISQLPLLAPVKSQEAVA